MKPSKKKLIQFGKRYITLEKNSPITEEMALCKEWCLEHDMLLELVSIAIEALDQKKSRKNEKKGAKTAKKVSKMLPDDDEKTIRPYGWM